MTYEPVKRNYLWILEYAGHTIGQWLEPSASDAVPAVQQWDVIGRTGHVLATEQTELAARDKARHIREFGHR